MSRAATISMCSLSVVQRFFAFNPWLDNYSPFFREIVCGLGNLFFEIARCTPSWRWSASHHSAVGFDSSFHDPISFRSNIGCPIHEHHPHFTLNSDFSMQPSMFVYLFFNCFMSALYLLTSDRCLFGLLCLLVTYIYTQQCDSRWLSTVSRRHTQSSDWVTLKWQKKKLTLRNLMDIESPIRFRTPTKQTLIIAHASCGNGTPITPTLRAIP